MKTKNNKKRLKISTNIKVIICMLIITLITFVINRYYNSKATYISTEIYENKIEYKKISDDIDLENIIQNNTENIEERIETQEIDLEYTTTYKNNDSLSKGTMQVLQEGRDGKQQIIIKEIYKDGELLSQEQIGNKIIQSSINKIIEIGTSNYASTYKPKKGDNLYVTSNALEVKKEPNNEAGNVIVLNKKDEVILQNSQDEWYQIKYKIYTGWVKADCTTYVNPNVNYSQEEQNTYTKAQLLAKLNINMKLNEVSGLSLQQYKNILSTEAKDTNNIFKNNAEYFYYAEKQYKVNGIFIVAVAIHESNWGTSQIAMKKNNLFGYGAYDRNPYESSYNFSTYAEGIDLMGRVFSKYYLNPPGTKIYDNEVAKGTYYNGTKIQDVNKKYATDKNWYKGIYKWMEYLYNKL